MRLRALLISTAALAVLPAAASAEPEFTGTLNASTPSFAWEGSGSGVTDPFGEFVTCADADIHACQDVLFNVQDAGDLTFTIDSDGDQTVSEPSGEFGDIATFQDIDTYLYPSDASGAIQGDSMSEDSASTKGDETFTMKNLKPGYYLLQVEVFLGAEASWTGKAELTNVAPKPAPVVVTPAAETPAPAAAVEPAPAPQAAPAAQAAPAPAPAVKAVSRKAACQKKAKKIKNKRKRKAALKKCAKLR